MSDEAVVTPEVTAEVPASAPEATAVPEAPAVAPEVKADETPKEPAKTFTQEELDAAISKRLARETRKLEREYAQRLQEAQAQAQPRQADEIKQEQFATPEAYAEALAQKKAEQIVAAREFQRAQNETLAAYHDREEEARGKYDDFEQVAYNPRLTITDVMAQTIRASESGPDVAYYLGANPKEADRIARLAPFLQAKEIGRIEAKLASDPAPIKKTSSAPAPITPVTPKSTGTPAYDTTDPRSTKSMSTSQWIEAERARVRKELEARAIR